jgi:uncharacterized protein (DUF302 family)
MWGTLVIGILIGIVLTVILEVLAMRLKMIAVCTSRFGFDETVEKLEEAIQGAGWSLAASESLNERMKSDGVNFAPRVQLLKLYSAEHSEAVLKENRSMACLMPCTFAVYEAPENGVQISKMNTRVMGKIFGGAIARIVGEKISADEEKILNSVL